MGNCDNIEACISNARAAMQEGEYEIALKEISSALLHDATHAEALLLATELGELLETKRLGALSRTESETPVAQSQPASLSNTSYRMHIAEAQHLVSSERYDEAMAEITKALIANPFAEEAQELECQLHEKINAKKTAPPIETPASVHAVLLVAKRYYDRKRFAEALEEVDTGLAIEGNHPELLWLRGAIIEQLETQGKHLRDHKLREYVGRVRERFAKTEFEKALEDVRAALEEFPGDRELLALKEEITTAHNSWQELHLFERHTSSVNEHVRNARQFLTTSRFAEAAGEIALGFVLAPYNEDLKRLEKELWESQSRLDQARLREEEERRNVQQSVTIKMHTIAAEEFARLGQFNRALDEIAQAYLIDPTNVESRELEGRIRQAQQRAAASPLKLVYNNDRAARA